MKKSKFLSLFESDTEIPKEYTGRFASLRKFADRNGYIGCSFIISAAIMWMIFIAMRVYPFGSNSVMVLDLNGQYVYFFEALRKAIYGDASLLYSWSRSLGGEFMGIYAYYLASPLSYIVALFPASHMTEALLVIIVTKCGLCGGTMAWYLRKTRPFSNEMITIAFSCMYALSSYVVVYGHNTMWIDALIWFPLVIYGTEQLICKHKFVLLYVSLTMTVLSTFYIGYMVCIFLVLYFFYFYFAGSGKDNNYYGESFHFIRSLIRMGCAAVVSVLSSCIIIIPTYYSLSFGKTDFSTVKWAEEFSSRFDILELVSKFFLGSYDTVRPEGLPWVYCGTAALILVPLYFCVKKISLREKIGALSIMLFLVLSMNLSALDIVWHGLQKPNWLNYRYSFMLIFLMIVFSSRALEEIDSIRIPFLAGSSIFITLILLIVQLAGYDHVDTFYCVWLSLIFIIVYTAILIPVIKNKLKPMALTGFAVVVCVEMFASGIIETNSLDADVTFSPKYTSSQSGLEGYNDFLSRMRGIVDKVQELDDSFYRMENLDIRKVCDNHALNLRGVSGSTSTLNAKTIAFLNKLGYRSTSHWSEFVGGTEVTNSLLGIKYIIYTSGQGNDLIEYYTGYDYTNYDGETKSMYAYKNPYALSVAYTANDAIEDFNMYAYTSSPERINALVGTLLGSETDISLFKEINYEYSYDVDTVKLTKSTFSDKQRDKDGQVIQDELGKNVTKSNPYLSFTQSEGAEGKIYFTFTVPDTLDYEPRIYAYMPSYDYTRSYKWEMNGRSGSFDSGNYTIIELGNLEPGKEYTMTVTMESTQLYIARNTGMFFYLDSDLFKETMETLAVGNLQITDYTETSLEGTVTSSEDRQILFTTIPYDEGWNVYVDGEKVDINCSCIGVISFDLGEAGEHTVRMVYWPKQLTLGIICTGTGVLLFTAWLVVDRTVFSKKRKRCKEALDEELANYRK